MKVPASRLLLAAASAGLLSASSRAADYDDTTSDLSDSSPGPDLSYLTYQGVKGRVTVGTDVVDYARLTDLPAGGTLTFSAVWSGQENGDTMAVALFNTSSTQLLVYSGGNNGSGGPSTLTIPNDGVVLFRVNTSGENSGNFTGYTLSYSAVEATVPEGSTAAAGATVGLAALLARRRRSAQA